MKVGLLVSRSGPAGLWAPPFDTGALLAAAELNAKGGVLGDGIELVIADAGITETEATVASGTLVDLDEVDAIVAMHPSNVRSAVTREVAGRVPYIYTPQYEGGERAPCTAAIGSTDEEMLRPSIRWLVDAKRAQRFFLVGNDYVWPRAAHQKATAIAHAAGASIVGECFMPFGIEDYAPVLSAIRRARPDVVVMTLLGVEAARFNRAFAQSRLAAGILRFGLGVDETVLYATGSDNAENLFTALNYVPSIRSAANDHFLELYHDGFGDAAPPAGVMHQFGYDGMHVVAGLASTVGKSDALSLARGLRGPISRSAARRTLPATPLGTTPPVHLAAADGTAFRVISSH